MQMLLFNLVLLHAGTMFCFGMSVFGCLFMGTMALLLKNNYECVLFSHFATTKRQLLKH